LDTPRSKIISDLLQFNVENQNKKEITNKRPTPRAHVHTASSSDKRKESLISNSGEIPENYDQNLKIQRR